MMQFSSQYSAWNGRKNIIESVKNYDLLQASVRTQMLIYSHDTISFFYILVYMYTNALYMLYSVYCVFEHHYFFSS